MKTDIKKQFEVDKSIDIVWEHFAALDKIVSCVPGAKLTEKIDDKNYKGEVELKIGPIKAKYGGLIEFLELNATEHVMKLKGTGVDEKGKEKNEPFSVVTVVKRVAPSSGKIGDKAIIDKDGEIHGWIGGGCVQGIAKKESDEAIETSVSRLVAIGNDLELANNEHVKIYKMSCYSEGKLEIFIEPILPQSHLIVIGKSSIAKALVHLAKIANYKITAVAENANLQTFHKVDELITKIDLEQVKTSPSTMIVVASQGEHDEKSLMESLKKKPFFIGFVATNKKLLKILNELKNLGVDEEELKKVKSPVGIDILAKQPYEVAISILAELIQFKNSNPIPKNEKNSENNIVSEKEFYINPVCNIPIDKKNAKHILEYKNEKVYFCCDGCKIKFESNPALFIK
ncbi:hypothetical protein CHS0354_000639 [Potamilus streckersoni]|uniref:TRASH domain-containing protein n=1 Tax=Potamilus streckersoni TaxID=2493646 RepID=A0AAE0T808_9BIVA|nr:hypothetical protein CHS0354_000639 [Potamilus streckersoni]